MPRKVTPRTAKSWSDSCHMERDNVNLADSWIMFEWPDIIICNQRTGQQPTGTVQLTRQEFERFIIFYETGR